MQLSVFWQEQNARLYHTKAALLPAWSQHLSPMQFIFIIPDSHITTYDTNICRVQEQFSIQEFNTATSESGIV